MKSFFVLFSLGLLLPSFAFQQAKPVFVIEKSVVGELPTLNNIRKDIIHESYNHWIVKGPTLKKHLDSIYYIQLNRQIKNISWLKKLGTVHEYVNYEFAIFTPFNKNSLLEISSYLHEFGGHCGTLQKLNDLPLVINQTRPLPIIVNKSQKIMDVVGQVDSQRILEDVTELVSWGTRYHEDSEGQLAGDKLSDLYKAIVPEDRDDVSVDLFNHSGSPQKSVIVRIEGKTKPNEIIVLGSHLDSINRSDLKNAPGADDNASGTSTNLEVFRLMMVNNLRPDRTIEIHAYAAEEIGLVGSGEIADYYKAEGRNVVSMVQFDMNGYSKDKKPKIYLVSNGTNSTLTNQLGELVDKYIGVQWQKRPLFFGSSDHASWNKRGYAAAFPTENPFAFNGQIHTSNDNLNQLNSPDQMGLFAQLGIAFIMTYGGY